MTPKFRAWHKELNRMFSVSQIRWHCETQDKLEYICFYEIGCDNEVDKIELLQWTGLQSKDKVDVYEGDILAWDHGGGIECFIIERNPDDFQLQARYLYMSGYNVDYLGEAPVEGSIIVGNQFENAKLLEAQE